MTILGRNITYQNKTLSMTKWCRVSTIVKCLVYLFLSFFAIGCSSDKQQQIDNYNTISYQFHYTNIDSTIQYAHKALKLSENYSAGRAEALNNLAFAYIVKMEYPKAKNVLETISDETNHQVELLVADIQLMRLCQRESNNKSFYIFRDRAEHRIKRINEEKNILSEREKQRLTYAITEMHIVASTYFYYVGLLDEARKELSKINPKDDIEEDPSLVENYYYNMGSGGMVTGPTIKQVKQTEFDYLFQCYLLSRRNKHIYWEANSLQALSELLSDDVIRHQMTNDNYPAILYLNEANMPDSLFPGYLAQRAVEKFSQYGDLYQISGSLRTLGSCYWHIQDYKSAIYCLQQALNRNKYIRRSPDLVSSICEQLSLAYSAINKKPQSDYYRNRYLDIQEQTRQDRQLEARAEQLDMSVKQLNITTFLVVTTIIIVICLFWLLDYLRRKGNKKFSTSLLLQPLSQWKEKHRNILEEKEELLEKKEEQFEMEQSKLINSRINNLEQRAKVFLAAAVLPFIDRMYHAVEKLKENPQTEEHRAERLQYINELTDAIQDYNELLTNWIQLRQGRLKLRIESFELQELFDVIGKSNTSFKLKNINFVVIPTSFMVKADRVLTLFMINTLIDNARKFTPAGGKVTVSAMEDADCVRIIIEDTGLGMTQEQIQQIFNNKPFIVDTKSQVVQESHRFGILNCRGIIEQYKKTSSLFNRCTFDVESTPQKGSKFWFRLPKGGIRGALLSLIFMASTLCYAQKKHPEHPQQHTSPSINILETSSPALKKADAFADSVYYCNVNTKYAQALSYADSCLKYLNLHYKQIHPKGLDLLVCFKQNTQLPAEILWFRSGIKTNYNIILDVRNESAIAALALHRWSLYQYNNKVYTQLFREFSADKTLEDYCATLRKTESGQTVGIVVLVLLLLLIPLFYYLLYYRHRLLYRISIDKINQINKILETDQSIDNKIDMIDKVINKVQGTLYLSQFPELASILKQIKETLYQYQRKLENINSELILADDELNRITREHDIYHVSNSIIDNGLSSLKHETMYFPARIKQLVTTKQVNIDDIHELISYYKSIYSILYMQSQKSVEAVRVPCSVIQIKDLLEKIPIPHTINTQQNILGDIITLKHSLSLLTKLPIGNPIQIRTQEDKDPHYLQIVIVYANTKLSQEECLHLFSPNSKYIECLLCRQVLRDIGDCTNSRSCGVQSVIIDSNQLEIIITLVKAKNKRL